MERLGLVKAIPKRPILANGTRQMVADLNLGNNKITSLSAPLAPSDGARLFDVQQAQTGLAWKDDARVRTIAALPSNTYDNGTAGVGATLTGTVNGALPSIDGIALSLTDRLLVNDEVAQANNGVYVVDQLGDGSEPYILTRATDSDDANDLKASMVPVAEGGTHADTIWQLKADNITVGTTALVYTQFKAFDNPAVPKNADKEQAPAATTGDNQDSTLTISNSPPNDGYVSVFVNGQKQTLGDGVKTKDCYFSGDAGTTARAIINIVSGDAFFWNGVIASFDLAATDIVDFDYDTIT